MKIDQVLELVKAVSESKVTTLEYKEGDTKIVLKTEEQMVQVMSTPVDVPVKAQGVEVAQEQPEVETKAGNRVKSPLVGTFYSAPAEDAEAYAKVGDVVSKGQTLAIVEAMKLMNEIESDYDGVVVEILVENGKPVEYGQPLFVIQ